MIKKNCQKCIICKKSITGVDKWIENLVFCVKCFRVVNKGIQQRKDQEAKNWYNPSWTESEYYHYVFDHFC